MKNALSVFLAALMALMALLPDVTFAEASSAEDTLYWLDDPYLLDEDTRFSLWHDETQYKKVYYVAPDGNDEGDGTLENPFETIKKANELVQPGEKIILRGGTYAETIRPLRGGNAPDAMIAYEAYPGETVIVTGLRLYKGAYHSSYLWKSLAGMYNVFRISVADYIENAYNPFSLNMLPHDWTYLGNGGLQDSTIFLLPRGKVVVDGEVLPQVSDMDELTYIKKGVWVESDGRHINIKWSDDTLPQHDVELMMAETLFNPVETGMGYIAIRGIRFYGCANGFPVPQNGAVSTNRGHHFIVEDCEISQVNGIALDMGRQCWNSADIDTNGHSVRRSNFYDIGVSAIAGYGVEDMLIEDNIIYNVCTAPIEFIAESAAIKLHWAQKCLLRGNRIYHTDHGQGIWLDYGNKGCRISGNAIFDCHTGNGGIMIEATMLPNIIDNNLVMQIECVNKFQNSGGIGITSFGSNATHVYRNFIWNCEGTALFINEVKRDGNRGGRRNVAYENVFAGSGRALVEIPSEKNEFEDNIYAPAMQDYIRIGTHSSPYSYANVELDNIRMDLASFQSNYNRDVRGAIGQLIANLDVQTGALEIMCDEETYLKLKNIVFFRDEAADTINGDCPYHLKLRLLP